MINLVVIFLSVGVNAQKNNIAFYPYMRKCTILSEFRKDGAFLKLLDGVSDATAISSM